MLKARPITNVGYYTELAHRDESYYLKGKEPAGKWYGKGCEEFNLSGEVKPQDFYALCAGKNPHDQTEKLVQNAGKTGEMGRRPGWDLTFSAPKSVSTLWASSDDRMKEIIGRLHEEAVKKALDYYSDTYAATRVGKSGTQTEQTNKLFYALFEHSTSRALDPQLHTHAVMVNLGINPRGQTKSLQTLELFRAEKEIGAFYRAELGNLLKRELGVDIEVGIRGTFEIKNVDKELMKFWSKRREEIQLALDEAGFSGGKASEIAALKTRKTKEYPEREELFKDWRAKAKEYGFDFTKVLYATRLYGKDEAQKTEFMKHLVEGYTQGTAYFTEQRLRQRVFELAPVFGVSTGEAIEMSKEWIAQNGVQLGNRKDGQTLYTTKEIDELEKKMIAEVLSGQDYQPRTRQHSVTLNEALSDEQRNAVYYITETKGQFKIVSGMAGTGKTTMLKEARAIWEAQGYEVKGISLAKIAAQNLEKEAGIKSNSVAKLLYDIGIYEREQAKATERQKPDSPHAIKEKKRNRQDMLRRIYAEYKHVTWQWSGETKKKYLGEYFEPTNKAKHEFLYATHQISKKHQEHLDFRLLKKEREEWRAGILKAPPLTEKTVLVLDEAGMVGTPQMAALIEEAKKAGAKLVMVGDAKQLQPIEHGNPFYTFGQELGQAELKEIRRQRELWAREAVTQLSEGKAQEALRRFDENGLLHVKKTRGEAVNDLVGEWMKDQNRFAEKLVVGTTHEDVKRLNLLAQKEREKAGELGKVGVEVGESTIFVNDRVIFTCNQKSLGLTKGEAGEVRAVNIRRNEITVKLDDGQMRTVPLDRYKDVSLGYAMTVHKAQGKTAENIYILAGSDQMQGREMSYVQASRARGKAHIYATEEQMKEGALARTMSQNQQKVLAYEWKEEIRAKRKDEEKRREQRKPVDEIVFESVIQRGINI